MPALALQIVPHRQAPCTTSTLSSVYGRSCGRWKYSSSFQLDCVPRNVFQSNSTSSPSAAKKPSCMATKSFSPMPFGATLTGMRRVAMAILPFVVFDFQFRMLWAPRLRGTPFNSLRLRHQRQRRLLVLAGAHLAFGEHVVVGDPLEGFLVDLLGVR